MYLQIKSYMYRAYDTFRWRRRILSVADYELVGSESENNPDTNAHGVTQYTLNRIRIMAAK